MTPAEVAVDRAIAELSGFDLVLDGSEPTEATTYIHRHRHEFVRTVRDVLKHRPVGAEPVKVLEIGAFFGVVCLALADLGYEVVAADIPEYIELPAQVERYARYGIETKGVRLEEFVLPFADEEFDVIILCEVLEHLNFNPLPLLKEVNRIGKPKSIFYVSMPNAANIYNRRAVMAGRSVGVPVAGFFEQLDPASSAISNGHWREYTLAELRMMLEPLGYSISEQYCFSLGEVLPVRSLRSWVARRFYQRFPIFKENQTTVAIREQRTSLAMRIPSTVHPTLRQF